MLVTCPECGAKISEQADPCPNCGLIDAGWKSEEVLEERKQNEKREEERLKREEERLKREEEKEARQESATLRCPGCFYDETRS